MNDERQRVRLGLGELENGLRGASPGLCRCCGMLFGGRRRVHVAWTVNRARQREGENLAISKGI